MTASSNSGFDFLYMKNILLACGAGASSGFIAQKMRKSAQKMNLDIDIRSVSDIEMMENISGIGVLLIGPHLKHKFADIQSEIEGYGIKAMITDRKYYTTLDAETIKTVIRIIKRKIEKVKKCRVWKSLWIG